MRIAVIGAGITGISAAWLLSKSHNVTLFEASARPGGHSNTVDADAPEGSIAVDTGFIVYNEAAYPNLTAFFAHLKVGTAPSSMTFGASLSGGVYEYAGGQGISGFFGQKRNWLNPGHWRLLSDVLRFTREALAKSESIADDVSLGAFLARENYGTAFIDRHILPMGAAIWSTPAAKMLDYPARSFIRFFANHGLLRVTGHPPWRTVKGGSREYVKAALADARLDLRLATPVAQVKRDARGVEITTAAGTENFDRVLIATHSDQALRLLADATPQENNVLADLAYSPNEAVLHKDKRLMPKRKPVWASWNFIENGPEAPVTVTYWMNRLQPLPTKTDFFVTLNPPPGFKPEGEVARFAYEHPNFDARALAAQQALWTLQGVHRTWFAGAWCGSGFHEDGIQAGLAAAEAMGHVRRPWSVPNESGRIFLGPQSPQVELEAAE
ncbi:MAG: FAD-dependent oxidoreductase [Aestuariivirgaceae bacterium]|nr:FAD-dependent oxidoreductase [Aestuariivirgaceae bacterium]